MQEDKCLAKSCTTVTEKADGSFLASKSWSILASAEDAEISRLQQVRSILAGAANNGHQGREAVKSAPKETPTFL